MPRRVCVSVFAKLPRKVAKLGVVGAVVSCIRIGASCVSKPVVINILAVCRVFF